jgi:SAM-dependent methyltransferase
LARILSAGTIIETYFNVPFNFYNAQVYFVNERIIEVPFVFTELAVHKKNLKILDFGCSESWLAISLASMGHHVYGIDLRDYPWQHKNLVFKKQNILALNQKDFDIIIAVSSLEHVGLGAYGEGHDENALKQVINKIYKLLKKGGKFILTVPVGKPFTDRFMRSFTPDEIESLLVSTGFSLEKSRYFQRINNKQWLPCSREEILEISNRKDDRMKSRHGSNGIGCLVFRKRSATAPYSRSGGRRPQPIHGQPDAVLS